MRWPLWEILVETFYCYQKYSIKGALSEKNERR